MANQLAGKIGSRNATVAVVGLGNVGLPVLRRAQKQGFSAIGLDVDEDAVRRAEDAGLVATTDPVKALEDADVVLISLPTPIDVDNRPNLDALVKGTRTVAQHFRRDSLVVVESTVAPGTCEQVVAPLLETGGRKAGVDFLLGHCPERIDPGNREWTLTNIPRVVGGFDATSTETTVAFYRELLEAEITPMTSLRVAEAVKIVENAFRDVNIAFVNELAKSFDKIGIDVVEVIAGAATKPFGFLPHYPGSGVGGECISVDPYYLIERAGRSGFDHRFLKLAREINSSMPGYTVQRVITGLNEVGRSVKGSQIAVLGVAYKPSVADTRGSPSLPILAELKALGARVMAFDPHVPEQSDAESLEGALEGSECVVIVTAHPEFGDLSPQLLRENGVRVLVDGRNLLSKADVQEAGIVYKGIGR